MKTLLKSIAAMAATSTIAAAALVTSASALTQSTEASGDLSLTSNGYWYGSLEKSNLTLLDEKFTNSPYADYSIVMGIIAGIIGKTNYTGNYKFVSVSIVGDNTKFSDNEGTSETIAVLASDPSGDIRRALYEGHILNGSGSGAEFLQGYNIEVKVTT